MVIENDERAGRLVGWKLCNQFVGYGRCEMTGAFGVTYVIVFVRDR